MCIKYLIFIQQQQQQYLMIQKQEQAEQKPRTTPRIGRPTRSTGGRQLKRQYQISQIKFQIECQLLCSIYEQYFIEPPLDPQNRRVEIAYMTALFQRYDCMRAYEVLLKLNQFYYKNSSIFPEDRLRYTSLIDIAYMVRQLRMNIGSRLRSAELVLTAIFYLYNQKVINLSFYQYLEPKMDDLIAGLTLSPNKHKLDRILQLIIVLLLEVSSKQEIKIKKQS